MLGNPYVKAFLLSVLVTAVFGGGLLETAWGWPRWIAAPVTVIVASVITAKFLGADPPRPLVWIVALTAAILVYVDA